MTARSLPVPRLNDVPLAASGAPRQRERTYLSTRLLATFCLLVALMVALTGHAAWQLQGAAAVTALALGAASIALTAFTAAWVLRGLVRPLGPATSALARMSEGDLSVDIPLERSGELRPLMTALHQVSERLVDVVSQVRTGTSNVALNAGQIARDNEALAVRTETQADSLQETAASMEELTAAVRQNAGTAQEAHALVRTATERAERGGEVMRQMVDTMGAIRTRSHSIRDIIGVIDGIAFQTNILALNAAVEAARAGEQGRGFAVVAAEVRSLAQRSAEAAREVKALIAASVESVDSGGARVEEAGKSVTEIMAVVRQVAQLIGHMDTASQEQSTGIETINIAVSRIDGTTQENAAFVKGAARTASALQERAVTLTKAVAAFSLGGREHGNPQEAMSLVHAACDFQRTHGRAAFLDDVNRLDEGRFVHRDLYLIVQNVHDGVFVGHGNNPGRLGKSAEVKDIDGKAFGMEFARVARDKGEGWVDYKWVHPVTGRVSVKSAYVRREGDLVISCAVYKT
jgi:methyl-accepting chemotaxis protein